MSKFKQYFDAEVNPNSWVEENLETGERKVLTGPPAQSELRDEFDKVIPFQRDLNLGTESNNQKERLNEEFKIIPKSRRNNKTTDRRYKPRRARAQRSFQAELNSARIEIKRLQKRLESIASCYRLLTDHACPTGIGRDYWTYVMTNAFLVCQAELRLIEADISRRLKKLSK